MACAYNTGSGVRTVGVTVARVGGTEVIERTEKTVPGEVAVTGTIEPSVCITTGGVLVAGGSCTLVDVGTRVTVTYYVKKIMIKK